MKHCHLVEDLWPLYEEGLVQPQTREWIEEHCASCVHCRLLQQQVAIEQIPEATVTADQAITRVTRKLQLYQLLLLSISFLFAMNTTLFSEQAFQFILSYFVLGIVVFSFYRSWLLTLLIAFIPSAIAAIYETAHSYMSISQWWTQEIINYGSVGALVIGYIGIALFAGTLHSVFTMLGATVAALLKKAYSKEEST